jgi:anti-anti-sigma factor
MADLIIKRDDARCRLYVAGEIDMATAAQLKDELTKGLEAWGRAEIDLAGVSFIDCSGLRILISAASTLRGKATIRLMCVSQPVRRVLELVGIDEVRHVELV